MNKCKYHISIRDDKKKNSIDILYQTPEDCNVNRNINCENATWRVPQQKTNIGKYNKVGNLNFWPPNDWWWALVSLKAHLMMIQWSLIFGCLWPNCDWQPPKEPNHTKVSNSQLSWVTIQLGKQNLQHVQYLLLFQFTHFATKPYLP